MRPALKPGLRHVWRNRDTVQIGIDPRRAVALTGMGGARGLLGLLDGSRDRAQVLAAARDLGIDPAAADRVLSLLAAGGALHDFPAGTYQALPAPLRARLAPELATAALAYGDADGGARILARRRAACVRVHGTSRAGLSAASLLWAAGVGLVVSTGPDPAGPDPAGPDPGGPDPGGPDPARPDQRRPGPARDRRRPDLVILADTYGRDLPETLLADGVPHLSVSASEAIGVVGPLVRPGRSACLRCLDLTRAERDPAWPLILAQLAGADAGPPACDAVLAAAVAAQAAAQALVFIDRGAAEAVTNGTLERVLPGWQWKRRTWRPHPRCGCGTLGAA
jgi:bacteriocin biosynthesis cyclodehydratase domain-containing protein